MNCPINLSRLSQIRHQHPGLILALGVYLSLASAYLILVPIFEGPDEWTHTGHVKHIAEGRGLPVMLPGQGIWGGQQPPLYYLGGAMLVQPFDLRAFEDYEPNRKNPHASLGYALDPGNKNNYLHDPQAYFFSDSLTLAVHGLRLYSMAFGVITLIFIYLIALEFPDDSLINRRFLATSVTLIVAGHPMFAFITALVANEPANIAGCTVVLWLAQRYVVHGPTPNCSRAVALGVALGLTSLAKMTGLAVGLVVVIALLQTALTHRHHPSAARWLWRDGLIMGLGFLLIGGWWYGRNYYLYGDFFQAKLYEIYFNDRPDPLTLSHFWYILRSGEVSFWATFGWLNIVAPQWVYTFYYVISRGGLLGVGLGILYRLGHNRPFFAPSWMSLRPLVIHLVFPGVLALSLTRLVAIEGGMQGRQLLPAIGSISLLMMWGWRNIGRLVGQWGALPILEASRLVQIGLMILWLGLAIYLPFMVVAPAYLPRPLLTPADLPPDLTRLDWTYNQEMTLLGVTIEAERVRPGERLPVTAYWRANQPMTTNYSVFVHLIGRQHQTVGQFNTYPGLGLRPTRSLQPGHIVVDTYPVLVDGGAMAPSRLLVNVGLFNFNEPGRPGIPAINPAGEAVPATVGAVKLIPHTWPPLPKTAAIADFQDHIQLVDYAVVDCQPATDECRLVFHWLAQGQPATNYTVFIQLWQEGQPAAGFDGPPLAGDYPTSLWAAGEMIIDPHPLAITDLPPGEYDLLVGWYDLATQTRLPVTVNGQPVSDYALPLGSLEIQPE